MGCLVTVEFREQLSLISPISELVGRVKLNWLEESSERKTRECEEKKKRKTAQMGGGKGQKRMSRFYILRPFLTSQLAIKFAFLFGKKIPQPKYLF